MREEVRRLNDFTCNKVNKYLAFACGLSRSLEGDRLFRLLVRSRFANVPLANVLCRSAEKRNERCACICFVLTAMIQKSAIRTYIMRSFSQRSGESRQGADSTRKRIDFRSWRTGRWRNDRKPFMGSSNGRCP